MADNLQGVKELLDSELKEFKEYFKNALKTNTKLLNSIISYSLKTQGKQMRPMLVLLCAKLLGETSEKTMVGASLIELLHNASLIHDDVVDESFYRRGLFSIFALWKAKISVLVGDYFLAQGLLLSVKHQCYDILEVVSMAVQQMSEGELIQIDFARNMQITEEDYYQIISKKTGSLISACCAVGALSVNANKDKIEKLKEFGLLIGIAFQIKDDLFDYEEDSSIGKPKFNDIQERKLTLPIINALNKTDFATRQLIKTYFRIKKKNSKIIGKIVSLVKQTNSIEYTKQKMLEYKDKALKILDTFEDCPAKQALIILSNYIVDRKK